MKTQIVFIHGGTAFSSYTQFLQHLRTKTIWDPYNVDNSKKWKETLAETFRPECDVLYPSMPNGQNAHYEEWKIWFERYFEYLNGNVMLIGHSLGGYFLAKYLSENTVPFPIAGLFLVAAPFMNDSFGDEDGGDFNFDPAYLGKIENMAQNILIYHSTDDEIVSIEHAKKYHNALQGAKYTVFLDRGHFLQPEFPEIVEDIKNIIKK